MDSAELRVMRRQTDHFIKDNVESVVIRRGGGKTPDGAGGYIVTPGASIGAQDMRLIPAEQARGITARNVDGEIIDPSYVVIAKHDADIKKGDVFIKDNRNYEVIFVRPDRRYETWAEVVYRG